MRDRINTALRRIPAWVIYAMAPLPVVWLVWQGFIGGLGVEPIRALEHELGEIGLQLLLAGLCVTPLRRYLGLNLLKFRRALGLVAFFYITLHLLVWLVLDVQIPAQIWADIVKRPYITVGMLAFVLMVPLALTSNNASVRRLGARWRWLHWLTYPVAVLGALHFVLLAKGFQIEPLIHLALALLLVALRGRGLWPWPVKPRGRAQAS